MVQCLRNDRGNHGNQLTEAYVMRSLCRELGHRPGIMAKLIARSKTLRVEVEDFCMDICMLVAGKKSWKVRRK